MTSGTINPQSTMPQMLASALMDTLIHPSQFSVFVARKKEGDSVKLPLLRKGAMQEIHFSLGKNDSGDVAGTPGTLQIGDVNIQIDGADNIPLRTIVKHLKMDVPSGGAVVEISGDRIKTSSDAHWPDLHEKSRI